MEVAVSACLYMHVNMERTAFISLWTRSSMGSSFGHLLNDIMSDYDINGPV